MIHFVQEYDYLGLTFSCLRNQGLQKSSKFTLCAKFPIYGRLYNIIWYSLLMQLAIALDTFVQSQLGEEWKRDQNMCLLGFGLWRLENWIPTGRPMLLWHPAEPTFLILQDKLSETTPSFKILSSLTWIILAFPKCALTHRTKKCP